MADKLILLAEVEAPHTQVTNLSRSLQDMGLTGERFTLDGHTLYRAGEHFLDLITFLGCSPRVVLDPDAGEDFCHVRIHASEITRCLGRPRLNPPRCPACRKHRIRNGSAIIERWENDRGYLWTCPSCGASMPPPAIDWRHGAGFGNLFIEIRGIQPELAVPGERLWQCLRAACPARWDYLFTE